MLVDEQLGWIEADIVINGRRLTFAESMAVRVAVSSFLMFVSEPGTRKRLGGVAAGYEAQLVAVEQNLRGRVDG